MLDLGTSFLASVARDPDALAIVDGEVRLSYRHWYATISALVGAFDELSLRPGDHLVTVLQNNWQPATVYWACQRAERAAALAHVAQNLYGRGERTLGVMPLYHTMGVRSLIAMSLVGGTFVCLPRFDAARALQLIAVEKITNLYLVPTLYHDLLHDERFSATDISSVRKLGFAGAPMTDGMLRALSDAFKP